MNILITGAWQSTMEQINEIRSFGHDLVFVQYEQDKLPCEYDWVEGVICNGLFLYHPIEKFNNLKFIQLTSAGYDRVPMDYIKGHNIDIYNAKGVYSIPMAEFAICGVLQLYKQSRFFYENQKQHRWEKHRGLQELNGKKVLIVGCGDVGLECAKRFNAFGCTVEGVNRSKIENDFFIKVYGLDKLEDLIGEFDIVVITIALTDNTLHLFNADKLKKMKSTAVLVNISRGAVIDQEALIQQIDFIGGAVLDVYEEEPLEADNPLWNKDNVIVSPHNSFVSNENINRLWNIIKRRIEW